MDIERIRTVIAELTLEEKLELCGCGINLITKNIDRLKVGSVKLPSSLVAARRVLTALGCSYNQQLATEYGKILGAEALIKGEALAGTLNIGVIRNPMAEGAQYRLSEEPLVVSELAEKIIDASAVKLIGTGILAGEYSFSQRYIDNRALREIYMRPFVKLGKKLGGIVVPAGSINGELASQSKAFMQLICDYTDSLALIINQFGSVVSKPSAIIAGGGFSIPNSGQDNHDCMRAIKDGHLFERRLDVNLERLVALIVTQNQLSKQPLPMVELDTQFENKLCAESCVLLKNMAMLPIASAMEISVNGDITKTEVLQLGNYFNVIYKKSAYINIVFLKLEGENYTNEQIALVAKTAQKCAETIVVLLSLKAAPLPFEKLAKAIIYMPCVGSIAIDTVAKIICGKINPSGKLNVSYALSPSDYPANMYKKAEGRGLYAYESVFNGYRYFNSFKRNVLFPFGHGLSYTRFEIYNQKLRVDGDVLNINFVVKNIGGASGGTVVFAFGSLPYDGIFGLKSRLAGFKKVFLDIGENTAVHMAVNLSDFSVFDSSNSEWLIPGGKYKINIGFSATDIKITDEIKIPKSTRYTLNLSAKDVPGYYTEDGFNPLGQDVEKVMQTPLMARGVSVDTFTLKPTEAEIKRLVKPITKKLKPELEQADAEQRLGDMSVYALEKLLRVL